MRAFSAFSAAKPPPPSPPGQARSRLEWIGKILASGTVPDSYCRVRSLPFSSDDLFPQFRLKSGALHEGSGVTVRG